ncbi:MAG: hypothetical protein M3463_18165 [Verrucomicrobiota bacterium]|nr:hypothetical protein [Verrucomicrobiota bacterium]
MRLPGADSSAAFARGAADPSVTAEGRRDRGAPRVERIFGAEIKRWTIATGATGLAGWEVAVHGLQATMVDVLVRVAFADGHVVSRLLRPDVPTFVFRADTAAT